MNMIAKENRSNWEIVVGPAGNTTWALAVASVRQNDVTVLAGTSGGLYRSPERAPIDPHSWVRLAGAPGDVTALALPPDFARDHMLWVGAQGQLLVSFDDGKTWRLTQMPRSAARVVAFGISPDLMRDGVIFAATMEDGVFNSSDRGLNWSAWNFGLLDLNILSLAVSPQFARDETVFAGTTTGLFYSYNGGRAWRELDFPGEAAPVLCLGISPNFDRDDTLFAGTEAAGMFRSADRGKTWQALNLGLLGPCINALVVSPHYAQDRTVLAATEEGIYVSSDSGECWTCLARLPGVMCLAMTGRLVVAGLL